MPRISRSGLTLIKRFEGFSPTVYKDAAGLPTIGYGHLIRPGETFPDPLSEREGEALLARDIESAERAVLRLIRTPLTAGQFAALVSFAFNLGPGALQRSTLRRKVNCAEHDEVPPEFMKWVWAGGRKLPGLIRRRAAEANSYETIG